MFYTWVLNSTTGIVQFLFKKHADNFHKHFKSTNYLENVYLNVGLFYVTLKYIFKYIGLYIMCYAVIV